MSRLRRLLISQFVRKLLRRIRRKTRALGRLSWRPRHLVISSRSSVVGSFDSGKISMFGCTLARFTRLTNAFSKKIENHAHSVALFAMYYNFVRIHKTLRTTPAMAANVTKRLWEIGDIVDVLEAWENTT